MHLTQIALVHPHALNIILLTKLLQMYNIDVYQNALIILFWTHQAFVLNLHYVLPDNMVIH